MIYFWHLDLEYYTISFHYYMCTWYFAVQTTIMNRWGQRWILYSTFICDRNNTRSLLSETGNCFVLGSERYLLENVSVIYNRMYLWYNFLLHQRTMKRSIENSGIIIQVMHTSHKIASLYMKEFQELVHQQKINWQIFDNSSFQSFFKSIVPACQR